MLWNNVYLWIGGTNVQKMFEKVWTQLRLVCQQTHIPDIGKQGQVKSDEKWKKTRNNNENWLLNVVYFFWHHVLTRDRAFIYHLFTRNLHIGTKPQVSVFGTVRLCHVVVVKFRTWFEPCEIGFSFENYDLLDPFINFVPLQNIANQTSPSEINVCLSGGGG